MHVYCQTLGGKLEQEKSMTNSENKTQLHCRLHELCAYNRKRQRLWILPLVLEVWSLKSQVYLVFHPQHTGMPPGPSWFFPCWLVSSALWLVSWPSSTTPPLMGLTRRLQPASSSSSHVSPSATTPRKPLWCSLSVKPNAFTSCAGFFVLLAMAVYTGVTVNYYGKRYGSWRFSWSYIMGWVAVVLTFFSGMHRSTLANETSFSCSHYFLNNLIILF